jgi:hypothetical protein
MAAMIKIVLEEEKPKPIFINSDGNEVSIDGLFSLFISTEEKTVFILPSWIEKYIIYPNESDHHSDYLFPNQAEIISLDNQSNNMIIASLYEDKNIFYKEKKIISILIKHESQIGIDAFKSIYIREKVC